MHLALKAHYARPNRRSDRFVGASGTICPAFDNSAELNHASLIIPTRRPSAVGFVMIPPIVHAIATIVHERYTTDFFLADREI